MKKSLKLLAVALAANATLNAATADAGGGSAITDAGNTITEIKPNAHPGVFFGLTYNFGGNVGMSLKVLSSNREDRGAFCAGISYFPETKKVGLDVGGAYTFQNGAVTAGWDILNNAPQMGVGYIHTVQPSTVVTPVEVSEDREL